MDAGSLSKLLALLASLGVAVLVIGLLTRHERQRRPRALVLGYPPGEFPDRDRIVGPLASLCQTQAALLARLRELPPAHPSSANLLVFLVELRALMDGAYALAALPAPAAPRRRLEELAQEARRAAERMIETTHQHSSEASEGPSAGLEWRVEVMKALARDIDEP